MKSCVRAFLIAGVLIPIVLHVLARRGAMPWWPDTVSFGIVLGIVTVLTMRTMRRDREWNRRLWTLLKNVRHHEGR